VKKYFHFLTTCLLILSSWVLAADGILIRLPKNVSVVGPRISFGEIGDVIGQNRAILEKIRRVDLGRAAVAGNAVKITQSYMKVVLRREGYSSEDFVFEGVQTVEVLTKSHEITTEDLLPVPVNLIFAFATREDKTVLSLAISSGRISPKTSIVCFSSLTST